MHVQFHNPNWRWKVSTQSAYLLCPQLVLSCDFELVGKLSPSLYFFPDDLSVSLVSGLALFKKVTDTESFSRSSKEWRIKHMPSYLHPHDMTCQLQCLEKYWYLSQSHKMETFRMLKLNNCVCSETSYFIGQNDFWLRIVLLQMA